LVGNRRVWIAVVAIVLAVAAGVGAYLYVSKADERAQKKENLLEAFVARQDVARGTSGDQAIANNLIEKVKVPRRVLPPAQLKNLDDIRGRIATAGLSAGQYVVVDSFTKAGTGGTLAGALPKDKQAISIALDAKASVGGHLAEGDEVNVIAVVTTLPNPDPGGNEHASLYAIQKAKVLAVGEATPTTATTNVNGQTQQVTNPGLLTLEVDVIDAERIALLGLGGGRIVGAYVSLVAPGYVIQNLPYIGDAPPPAQTDPVNRRY
jgi:pilus assembly protein CpaB